MDSSPRDQIFGPDDDRAHGAHRAPEASGDLRAPQPGPSADENHAPATALLFSDRAHHRATGATGLDGRHPNRKRGLAILVSALALVLCGAIFAWNTLGLSVPSFSSSGGDYAGNGDSSTAEVKINPGDAGSTVGSALVAAGITKSTSVFVAVLTAEPSAKLTPGVYRLRKHQSAASALAALQDPANRVGGGVVIQEGLWESEIFAKLSKATGHPVSEYEKVTANELGLPATMNGKLEGWLFPSTYNFDKSMSARTQLQTMVNTLREQIQPLNIQADQIQKVLTKASIIQAESPNTAADGQVARVIENRLAKPMKLQMDSSIHYILHKRGTIATSLAETQNPSPYNSYKYEGLPPTPYDSPGLDAIKAAVNPTPGPWLYFVAVNPVTGETKFATTYADQLKNQAQYTAWCKANPGHGC